MNDVGRVDEQSSSLSMTVDVHIFDTDCYGVMWHGAYTKWMEMGRVNLLRELGIELSPPGNNPDHSDAKSYIYPVVEQVIKFRSPARLNDQLLLKTTVSIEGHKIFFHAVFENKTTGKVAVESVTTGVILDSTWRVQRKIPPEILEKLITG